MGKINLQNGSKAFFKASSLKPQQQKNQKPKAISKKPDCSNVAFREHFSLKVK
jgi:hypothetical protein